MSRPHKPWYRAAQGLVRRNRWQADPAPPRSEGRDPEGRVRGVPPPDGVGGPTRRLGALGLGGLLPREVTRLDHAAQVRRHLPAAPPHPEVVREVQEGSAHPAVANHHRAGGERMRLRGAARAAGVSRSWLRGVANGRYRGEAPHHPGPLRRSRAGSRPRPTRRGVSWAKGGRVAGAGGPRRRHPAGGGEGRRGPLRPHGPRPVGGPPRRVPGPGRRLHRLPRPVPGGRPGGRHAPAGRTRASRPASSGPGSPSDRPKRRRPRVGGPAGGGGRRVRASDGRAGPGAVRPEGPGAAPAHRPRERPRREPVPDGKAEAERIAPACSAPPGGPPGGAEPPADQRVERAVAEAAPREAVRRTPDETFRRLPSGTGGASPAARRPRSWPDRRACWGSPTGRTTSTSGRGRPTGSCCSSHSAGGGA